MPRWLTILLGAGAIVAVFFGFRTLMSGGDSIVTVEAESIPTLDRLPPAGDRPARDGMQVAVRRSVAEVRPLYLSLSGRTEAARTVTVRAQTTGTVSTASAVEGRRVAAGDLLCGMDADGRGARVREAEAELAKRRIDYEAAVELAKGGWASEARVNSTKASMDAAMASLEVARSEHAKTFMRAPFAGVFEKRMAGAGDFLNTGDACGVVVELDPLLVGGEATERQASQVRLDAPARVRLSDGTEARGRVRYVARTANPSTRTFRVEIEIPNAEHAIPVGRTGEIRIQTGQGDAHRVNPSLLTLDAQGRIGLRYLDVGGVVNFAAADVVEETADGVWVAGLPREALIVTEGQENVRPGLRATPVVRE